MSEEPAADDMADEFDVIARMLLRAKAAGMTVEVVYEYAHNIKRGYTPGDAALHALYEWDC